MARLELPDSEDRCQDRSSRAEAAAVLHALPRVLGNPYVIVGDIEGEPFADLSHLGSAFVSKPV